ncbi:MAG: ATP-binding protein [Candidatus Omnitrophota bacterium]
MNDVITVKKYFNTAGPCSPEKHYMVDPLKRLKKVEQLINQELYFTIHAPRQTGKTTYLHALVGKLNADGKYIAMAVSFERGGIGSFTVDKVNETLINSLYVTAPSQLEEKHWPPNPEQKHYPDVLNYLQAWCESQEKPIVLFIDEIDALLDDALISVLRQLRDGYQRRPKYFPSSIVLVGLRDVRDYKIKVREENQSYGAASPFNIKSDSLLMNNFKKEEVYELLEQHTTVTGQEFPVEVKDEIFRLTNGQPWLVNALARQMVDEILNFDFSQPINLALLNQAKIQLIQRRDTHLDSLVDKLRQDRVKKIVQVIINGDNLPFDVMDDDILYVRDLGIVSQTSPLEFANPIYAEIIPRIMASSIQESLPKEIQTPCFVNSKGELDMEEIFKAFQDFYCENAEHWLSRFEYKESAQHLLLMAFLQRVINSGGEIVREMAVGNGRVDLLVKFHDQRTAIEIKIKRGEKSIEKAKRQLSGYLNRLQLNKGYLVIFDPSDIEWEKKIYMNKTTYNDKTNCDGWCLTGCPRTQILNIFQKIYTELSVVFHNRKRPKSQFSDNLLTITASLQFDLRGRFLYLSFSRYDMI